MTNDDTCFSIKRKCLFPIALIVGKQMPAVIPFLCRTHYEGGRKALRTNGWFINGMSMDCAVPSSRRKEER